MFIIPQESISDNKCFYAIYSTAMNENVDFIRSDVLSSVREKFFKTGKKIRNRKIIYQGSDAYKYSYNLSEKFPMKWKKLKNGVLVESTQVDKPGVYSIVSYGVDMLSPIKKINFSASHKLLSNEYFSRSNPNAPFMRITFSADKHIFLEEAMTDGNMRKTLLVLCEYIPNEKSRNSAIRYCGSPEVIAKSDMGFYYFCSVDKAKAIESFLEGSKKSYFEVASPEGQHVAVDDESDGSLKVRIPEIKELVNEISEEIDKKDVVAEKKLNINSCESTGCPYANKCTPFQFSECNENVYFFGNTENGMRNGYGITASKEGIVLHSGYYTENKKDGFGTSYYENGNISHIGSWKDGKKEGVGVHFNPSAKTITIGNWNNDVQDDVGSVFDERGNLVFIGNWSTGERKGAEVSYSSFRGNIFIGKYEDGHATNKGTLLSLDGKLMYRGEIFDSKRNGFGVAYDENENIIYEGNFKDDAYNGEGVRYIKNNHKISATFSNGEIQGIACEIDETGFVIYKGEWKDNLYHGKGCRFFHSGGRYEGQFESGSPVGKLKGYNHEGELVYIGEWDNDMFNGEGTYYVGGEKYYEGSFKDDRFHGKGFEYKNGECVYAGELIENKRCGLGTSYIDGKVIYSGDWEDDTYNGFGVLNVDENITYVGEFSYGKKNGRINLIIDGVLSEEQIYENDEIIYSKKYEVGKDGSVGIVYASNVRNGKLNGMGCEFDKYGNKKQEGLFINNELTKSMKVSIPELKRIDTYSILKRTDYKQYIKTFEYVLEKDMSGKFTYTGELRNEKPVGLGTALFKDHIYTGNFVNGQPEGEGIIYESNGTVFEGTVLPSEQEGSIKLAFEDSVVYYLKRHEK